MNVDTIVIGGGQAGIAAAYYLQKAGRQCLIIDQGKRIGDVWRKRYDSLVVVYTPVV